MTWPQNAAMIRRRLGIPQFLVMQKQTFKSYDDFLARYRAEVPDRFNFAFDVVDRIAAEDPTRRAMIHIDDREVRRDYDIRFFSEESSRLAAGLARHGIGKGDRVVLMLYRRVEFWSFLLAVHKLGAVAVPLPAKVSVKDIEYRLQFGQIQAAIIDETMAGKVEEARATCPTVRLTVHVGDDPEPAGWIRLDALRAAGQDGAGAVRKTAGGADPLFVFFSSGTTGAPKMVQHDHNYALGHMVTAMYWHDLRPGDIHLTVADSGWAKAAWGKLYGQWLAGGTVFAYDFRGKFDAHKFLELMAKHKVTTFCAPPTVYRLMIHQHLKQYDLSSLRHCTSAGELLNRDIFDTWKAATGLPLYEGYGQTETTLQIATFPFMKIKPGSMGRPCPDWDVVLLDEKDQPVPVGQEAEICIRLNGKRPIGFFCGYDGDPELTNSVIRNGFYHTGDKAYADADGYYWFLGRNDDLIKSSGYRIGPFEVESVLATHPAVRESAVTGLPDAVRGQIVKATVVLAPGYEPSEQLVHDLQEHVKSITAGYKYPRIIEFVEELPKTISGKIRRAEIRARDALTYSVVKHEKGKKL